MTRPPESGIEARTLELREFSFALNPDPPRSEEGGLVPPEYEWETSSAIDRDRRLLHVASDVRTLPEEDGSEAAFRLYARVVVEFIWSEDIPLDIDTFARKNAVAFAWPYLRELVWNFTVRGNLPPLFLPLLNFAEEGVELVEAELEPL